MLDRILAKFFNLVFILVGVFLILFGMLYILPSEAASPTVEFPAGFSIDGEEIAAWRATQEANQADIPLLLPAPLPEDLPADSIVMEPPVPEQTASGQTDQAPDQHQVDTLDQHHSMPAVPERLVINSINLNAPVVPALARYISLQGRNMRLWDVPAGYLVGWHPDSVGLGQAGNLVLNGHHNIHGQVFARLIDVDIGDEIHVYGGDRSARYRVTEKFLLPEMDQPLDVRLANARFIRPTADSRLTLVTCWPYETNTHRLIVIATPVEG
jgi:LPXTG-site transpeptidase (sortase) family protein